MKNDFYKKQKGVSMVSLVITIVVMLVLGAVVFISSTNSIKNAGVSVFVREVALVRQAANEKKLDNQVQGTSEEKTYKGFYKSKVKNPPMSFASFDDDEIYGYVIDLEYVHTEDAERGHDYKRYAVDIESNIVEFGKDDVYICDKDGNVFYAKGLTADEGIYYSNNGIELFGPEIVNVEKIISADRKSANIKVSVKRGEDGALSAKIGGIEGNRVSVSEDGTTETFEVTVYENKTYVIIAEETGRGRTSGSVDVTELDVVTYTIRYEGNGGTNVPEAQLKTENVIMKLSTKVPERTGYTFIGWNENPSAEVATYKPGGEFVFDKDTTLYAIWKIGKERTYDVTYNANGGEQAPQGENDISGDYVITSQVPIREGYGFIGWSEDAKATTPDYIGGDTVTLTKNLTLYAIWSKGTYTVTVTVNPEGAGTVTGNVAKPDGVETFISTTGNAGYVFKNWSVKSGSVNLKNATSTSTSFIMPQDNVEIVANYEVGGMVVRYNANKGSGAPSARTVKYGDEIEITSAKPIRKGYDFVGWALKPDAETSTHHEGQKYLVTENVTFYAVWKVHIEIYTLKFNLNGGYGNVAGEVGKFVDQTKLAGATIVIPVGGENEPYRKDYVFKGWSLSAESDEVVLRPGDTYVKDADMEIFAVWKDELPPELSLAPKQEEGSTEVQIVATAHDEGIIAEYAWTMTDTYPSAWETEGAGTTDLVVEKTVNEKGENYFWVKDVAGNYSVQSMMAYEIKYDANGGINAPKTQYQLKNTDLILSNEKPTREKYTFLGWSTSANPGNTDADVNFKRGVKLNLNADTLLKAVWGEAFFTLSTKTGVTQIDGPSINVTVTKSAYTGDITVSSSDEEIATATITNNVITIVPGTKIGDVTITVTEGNEGTTETILVTVNRGIRKLTLDKTEHAFTYGDSSVQIGFTYNGKATTLSTLTSNSTIATASAVNKTLTIKPGNYGTAVITLVLAQDDQYLEKTADVQVSVSKKKIVVTPMSNQSKVYDGNALTPTLTYTYAGNVGSEEPKFNGELTRAIGKDVGKYEITLGNLELANNGDFIADNYNLELSATKVYFEITPKRIIAPLAITPQEYDGTVKYGIEAGEDYVRGGEYQKTNAGTYTAIATLNDTKNFVWDDTNTTTARNIRWEITRFSLTKTEITIDPVSSRVYTGSEITPLPVVRNNGTVLQNGIDYTLTYANNINIGIATITVTGKGNYEGTITTTFEITKATMQLDVSGYTGIFDNANHGIKVSPIWPSSGYTIYYSTVELNSENYTSGTTTKPTYKNIGTTTVYYYVVAPNFEDAKGSAVVTITQKDISGNITISGVVNKSYTGNPITQVITVKDNDQGRNLSEGTEYTVSYSNNVNIGTATVTVTGMGNYKGTKTATFSILGDTITITKNTEALVTELTITISKNLPVGTLQYKINSNGSWTNYTGPFVITSDCTIYAQSVHNGNVIGSNQLVITNICEHEYTAATCTEDSKCIYCGLVKEAKLGHDFTSKTPTDEYLATAATCTTKAKYYHKCIRCTAKGTTTYENGEPLGHTYTSQTATSTYLAQAATCTTKAKYYYKCIRCTEKGTSTYEYGSALGHDFTSKTQTTTYWKSDATCTVPKTYYYKCSRCTQKGTSTYTVGSALGHDFDETDSSCKVVSSTYLASAATCTEPAKYYLKCSRCSVAGTETFTNGNPAGHTYGNYVVITAATCTSTGLQRRTCTKCGATEDQSIAKDASNHSGTEVATVTKAATCTATGTRRYNCSNCSALIRTETIPLIAHSYGSEWKNDTNNHWNICSSCGQKGNVAAHTWSASAPPRQCTTCGLQDNAVAQAIYCSSNGSLTFYYGKKYTAGETFSVNGRTVTKVYTGFEEGFGGEYSRNPWYTDYNLNIYEVVADSSFSTVKIYDCDHFLAQLRNCNYFDLRYFDVSECTTLGGMFTWSGYNVTDQFIIEGMDNWNTSKNTSLDGIFYGCGQLVTGTWSIGDLSNWDTAKVTATTSMFREAGMSTSRWSVGDISGWNMSRNTNIHCMFHRAGQNASNFYPGNIGSWDTSSVENMRSVFYHCGLESSGRTLDLSSWNCSSVVEADTKFCRYVESYIIQPKWSRYGVTLEEV